jgi:hemolysin III
MLDRALTIGEEIANSVTHGLGLLASLIAFPLLVVRAQSTNDSSAVAGAVIFGLTLILAYATSTVYHALPVSNGKQFFRLLDHSAIYLLIAGTYTPFALGPLRGTWGTALLVAIWSFALIGIASKIRIGFRRPHLSTIMYLVMGWLIVVAIKPLVINVPRAGLIWLAAGGLAYTGGVFFYVKKRIPYGHMIWHLFVAAGSACHFVAVFRYAIKT